jgi:hypothetical protein
MAEPIRSVHLPENWEPIVRQMLNEQHGQGDPESEREEIRGMLRLMRENYVFGLDEGEEYQYWRKVNTLEEKLELLNRIPVATIDWAAYTLLDLHESWE